MVMYHMDYDNLPPPSCCFFCRLHISGLDCLHNIKHRTSVSVVSPRRPKTSASEACSMALRTSSWTSTLVAVNRSGELIDGRPLIISIMEQGAILPFYTLVRGLPVHAKRIDVADHFASHDAAERAPVVHMPMSGNLNKTYCFVYVASLDHLRHCLALDQSSIRFSTVRVVAGLFPDGRGLRRNY